PATIAVGGLSQAKFSTYAPDSVVAYEVGVKSSLDGGRLRLNLSAYDDHWKDIQTLFSIPGGLNITANGPRARTRGAELESSFSPNRYVTLFSNLSYVEAKFDETRKLALGGANGTTITPQTRIPNVPDWKADVGI